MFTCEAYTFIQFSKHQLVCQPSVLKFLRMATESVQFNSETPTPEVSLHVLGGEQYLVNLEGEEYYENQISNSEVNGKNRQRFCNRVV